MLLRYICGLLFITSLFITSLAPVNAAEIFLGQGTMSGEVTDSSVLLQTRLTAARELNAAGDLPGIAGVAYFQWSEQADFVDSQRTTVSDAVDKRDFIVRHALTDLKPNTRYYFRTVYGQTRDSLQTGETCSFKTHPGATADTPVRFIVGSCMNYNKFMHGKLGNAGGPLTATPQDKRLGYPALATMRELKPDFFIGTGDIVYYDNKFRRSESLSQLRLCWHEQFRFPRMIDFLRDVPTYWSKDDHDFRFNDSDNVSTRLPLPTTGIGMFFEQLPIAAADDPAPTTYRTYRVSRNLQIWMTEGRDFRSPNKMADGPQKSLWGDEQRQWLQSTLLASDAKWKILISPTPMVGPDDAKKTDNHANLSGFRHEANSFFDWLGENEITNFVTICGDRHWQYHSIHPSGVNEFACGALNDENARYGVEPGDQDGTDPGRLVKQPFISPTPSGGFLQVTAGRQLKFDVINDDGKPLYSYTKD